jgi:flavin-dependent dehydrogenase
MKGHLVRRYDFDNLLLDQARAAGVEVVLENEIVAIEQLRKGVRALGVGDSYKAQLLVGADGVNGPIMKQLGIRKRWAPDEVAVCIVGEVPMESSEIERFMTEDTNPKTSFIELYYGLVEWGFGWCFPYKDALNIGIGCRVDKAGGIREKWSLLLDRISKIKEVRIQTDEKTSATVPFGGIPNRVTGRRTMLIGDAAGLVSPISGEGISFAIESGLLAAAVATETVQDKSPVHVVEYDRRLKKTLLSELKDLQTLTNIFYKSNENLEMLFDIVDDDPRVCEYMTDILTRHSTFSELKYKLAKRLLTRHPRKAIKLGL